MPHTPRVVQPVPLEVCSHWKQNMSGAAASVATWMVDVDDARPAPKMPQRVGRRGKADEIEKRSMVERSDSKTGGWSDSKTGGWCFGSESGLKMLVVIAHGTPDASTISMPISLSAPPSSSERSPYRLFGSAANLRNRSLELRRVGRLTCLTCHTCSSGICICIGISIGIGSCKPRAASSVVSSSKPQPL